MILVTKTSDQTHACRYMYYVFAWLVRNPTKSSPAYSRGAWRYCLGHRVLCCMTCVVNFVFALSQLQGVEWGWPGRREPDDEHSPASYGREDSSLFIICFFTFVTQANSMRDRKRKIPDRKSAVFDLAKSFSFREQKLSYVRSKNRLGFTCRVSCMPLFASSIADRKGILVLWDICTYVYWYYGISVHIASSY